MDPSKKKVYNPKDIAPGNGPLGFTSGTGRVYHLGTNYGDFPWCGGKDHCGYGATSSGPLVYPDKWCPNCVAYHRKLYPKAKALPKPINSIEQGCSG